MYIYIFQGVYISYSITYSIATKCKYSVTLMELQIVSPC